MPLEIDAQTLAALETLAAAHRVSVDELAQRVLNEYLQRQAQNQGANDHLIGMISSGKTDTSERMEELS